MSVLLLATLLPLHGASAEGAVAACAHYRDPESGESYDLRAAVTADPGVSPQGGVDPEVGGSTYAGDDYASGLKEVVADFSDGRQDGDGVLIVAFAESSTGQSGEADTARPRGHNPAVDCPTF